MRRFWLCLAVMLLSGQKILAQEGVTADEMLKRAVEKSRVCEHETRTADGKKENSGREGQEDTAGKLSLAILFRPGRFSLKLENNAPVEDGRSVDLIRFTSKPEKEHLKALKGEDKKFNWAMNRMHGTVTLDRETGGIIRIEAKTEPNLPAKKFGIKYAELQSLMFSLEQKLVGDVWLPERSRVAIHVWSIFRDEHNEYLTQYHCTK